MPNKLKSERRRRQLRDAEKRYRKKRRIKRCRPTAPGTCPAARLIRDRLIVDLAAHGLLQKQIAYYAGVSGCTVYTIVRRAGADRKAA